MVPIQFFCEIEILKGSSMTNKISIGLGLANLPQGIDTEEIKRFIAAGNSGHSTYILAPA